ncbi:hypothetical protein P8452_10711 [Trifolium repens]|nr:hypothetical protein P8452_10711 [Trifolium repens]
MEITDLYFSSFLMLCSHGLIHSLKSNLFQRKEKRATAARPLHLRPELRAPLFLSGRPQLPVRASLSFSGRRSLSRNFEQRLKVKEVEETM